MPKRSGRTKTGHGKSRVKIAGKKGLRVDLTLHVFGTVEQTGEGGLDFGSLLSLMGPMLAKAGRHNPHEE